MSEWVFKPRLRPTLFTVPALIILVILGTWQLHRLEWKRTLLHEIATNMARPPAAFPDRLENPGDWSYRRVRLSGVFDHAREIYLFAPGPKGGAGYQVITPLHRDRGVSILVNRGWVPARLKDPAARAAGQLKGVVALTGLIRPEAQPNMFSPANRPDQNIWYWRDIPSMARHLDMPVASVVVDADATANPGGWPQGGQTIINIPNNHLDYALTWYGLALVLVVIYVVYHRRRR